MSKPGRLILVATPIGNLGDFSKRAIETLQLADLILCEDTRHSSRLFTEYGIQGPRTSYGSHNVKSKVPWILEQLRGGKIIAQISDAGMPGISDPGAVLVKAAVEAGITVSAVPGSNAMLMALVLSGLPTDRFVFDGFLPNKKGRQTKLKLLAEEPRTIVLYESPHRILKTLSELEEYLGDRQAAVCRELTKIYEEVVRGKLSELRAHFEAKTPKGEFVVVVAGTTYKGMRDEERTPLLSPQAKLGGR
jgi:16S rRNA (cytidine1402-2'-O)-methyltransferase